MKFLTWFKNLFPKPKKKRKGIGYCIVQVSGQEHKAQVIVEEEQTIGSYSMILILDVTQVTDTLKNYVRQIFNHTLIETNNIEWFSENNK